MRLEVVAERETALQILRESNIKGSDRKFLERLINQYYLLKEAIK